MTTGPHRTGTAVPPLLDKLSHVVRPEFAVELIRIDPTNPVFARGR